MFKKLLPIAFAVLFHHGMASGQQKTVARLFWQDDATAELLWGDLKRTTDGFSISANEIVGFPKLDVDYQGLVQMQADAGVLVVGIHDHNDGAIGSGWVALEIGGVEESHGDHSHWTFPKPPRIAHTSLDTNQGNPAHVYQYGRSIVLANDKKDGFTIVSAKSIRDAKSPDQAAQFFAGGTGHITLAVADNHVAYATSIAAEGDNAGRVDVVGLGDNQGKGYRFHCPSGTLHGATVNSGKAFFAPSDGLCWVTVDTELDDDPNAIVVHQLSLGKDLADKPLRTGAFTNVGHHVLFTAGKGEQSKLCIVDASADNPTVTDIHVDLDEGQSLMTPIAIRSSFGKQMLLMFAESQEDPESDHVWIADLDPNRDGDYSDIALGSPIAVGRNQIVGHSGHHDAAAIWGGRYVAITNPGDQSLWVVSLATSEIKAKLELGGTPTRLIAQGD